MMSSGQTLPPGLDGDAKCYLLVTIDEILWVSFPQPVQVQLLWWGEEDSNYKTFTPVDVKNFHKSSIGDILYVRYEVRTSLPKFRKYLEDASPLKIDIVSSDLTPIAFTVVQNLNGITEKDGLEGYYPVIDLETRETVANLRIEMKIEPLEKIGEIEPPEKAKPKITIKSKPRKSTSDATKSQKVTFSDQTLGSTSFRKTPLADSLVSELLNQSQQLRESMQSKIESSFKISERRESEQYHFQPQSKLEESSDESLYTVEYSEKEDGLSKPVHEEPREAIKPVVRELVPTWNLPVERMKHLVKVTRLLLYVSSVQLNPLVLSKIMQKENKKLLPKFRMKDVSFFVKFKFPDETSETSLCSRKLKDNFVDFNEKKLYPILFNSQLLEDWWNYKLEFKVYSRELNQRIPLLLGESSLGLKHLLLFDKYSSGDSLSLPLYSSTSLFRDLKLPLDSHEIIGNVHVSLKFEFGRSAVGSRIVNHKNIGEKPSSSKDPEQAPEPRSSPTKEGRNSVTINSRTENETGFSEPILLQLRVQLPDSNKDERLIIKHRNLEGTVSEGEVGEGQELVVTTSLFLPGQEGNIHNRLMFSRLNKNYLVLEGWKDESLLGVSKIQTDILHSGFKQLRVPEIIEAFNGRVPIMDLFTNTLVGELQVSLRAGTSKYILPEQDKVGNLRGTDEKTKSGSFNQSSVAIQTSFIDYEVLIEDEDSKEKPSEDENMKTRDAENKMLDSIEKEQDRSLDANLEKSTSVEELCLSDHPEKSTEPTHQEDGVERVDVNSNILPGLRVQIVVEEARNLPNVKSKGSRVSPCCYVTLLEGDLELGTQMVEGNSPTWNYSVETRIPESYVTDPRKYLIFKVWHHRPAPDGSESTERKRNSEFDQVLGFIAVDLTPLLSCFPSIRGWYNITDWLGKCRGQVKLSVTPLEDVSRENMLDQEDLNESHQSNFNPGAEFVTSSVYKHYPSHLVNHPEQIIMSRDGSNSSCSFVSENQDGEQFWKIPVLSKNQDNPNLSTLERTLSRHLSDLSNITKNLLRGDTSTRSDKTYVIQGGRNQENKENRTEISLAEEQLRLNLDGLRSMNQRGLGANENEMNSSRTSLQSLSVDELPRDDQPNLADLGLVLEDLGQYLGVSETDRSKMESCQHFLP